MGGGVGGDEGGGEGGGANGGGGEGGDEGGGGEGGKYSRGPQSSQSVPRSQWEPSAPVCPSWQRPLLMYCWPPSSKELRQVFSQSIGGSGGGEGGGDS